MTDELLPNCQGAFVDICLTNLEKYGPNQKGLIVLEDVKKGTKLWPRMMSDKCVFTRSQLEQLKLEHPEFAENIDSFSCQNGHDLFTIPKAAISHSPIQNEIDFRQYVNHSCSPNCGYYTVQNDGTYTIAIRDLKRGDELTIHYGMLETEISFTYGLKCRCGSSNCQGVWKMNLYRGNSELLMFAKPELASQVKELRNTFWYSEKCWIRKVDFDDDTTKLALVARVDIEQNEIVAHLRDKQLRYIQICFDKSNCNLEDESYVISTRKIKKNEIIYL